MGYSLVASQQSLSGPWPGPKAFSVIVEIELCLAGKTCTLPWESEAKSLSGPWPGPKAFSVIPTHPLPYGTGGSDPEEHGTQYSNQP